MTNFKGRVIKLEGFGRSRDSQIPTLNLQQKAEPSEEAVYK